MSLATSVQGLVWLLPPRLSAAEFTSRMQQM